VTEWPQLTDDAVVVIQAYPDLRSVTFHYQLREGLDPRARRSAEEWVREQLDAYQRHWGMGDDKTPRWRWCNREALHQIIGRQITMEL